MFLEPHETYADFLLCVPGWWWRNLVIWSSLILVGHPISILMGVGVTLILLSLAFFPVGIFLAVIASLWAYFSS